jgi:hypothetical protein
VVQQGLHVAEVATEGSVSGGLVGKAVGVDPPIVLVAGAQQLVVVEVDKARDVVSQTRIRPSPQVRSITSKVNS